MAEIEKTNEEINELVNEFRKLKAYDRIEYEKKINELKKKDSSSYYKVIIMLNIDSKPKYFKSDSKDSPSKILQKPILKSDEPSKIPKQKEAERQSIASSSITKPNYLPSQNAEIKKEIAKGNSPKPEAKKEMPPIAPLPKPEPIMPAAQPEPIAPSPNPQPAKPAIKPKAEKKQSPLAFSILGIAVVGIALVSIMGFFLFSNPPATDTSRNSLRLGYELFNELNDVYLNYTYAYNSSDSYIVASQFCSLKTDSITCAIRLDEKDLISRQQNGFLYYDFAGENNITRISDLNADNELAISLYNEAYNLVNNYYALETGRDDVWDVDWELEDLCAPLFFEINVSKAGFENIESLKYEMCLNNDGVPFAIAKQSIYPDSYEIIVAYLENMNPQIKDEIFSGQTLEYWENFLIDDY